MITKINPTLIAKFLNTMSKDLLYVSLLEEMPTGYTIKNEVRSQGYRRARVYWKTTGAMIVNSNVLIWRNLETPVSIRAYGLHAKAGDGTMLGWGPAVRGVVIESMSRGDLSKHTVDVGALSIRVV